MFPVHCCRERVLDHKGRRISTLKKTTSVDEEEMKLKGRNRIEIKNTFRVCVFWGYKNTRGYVGTLLEN